jgi:hypothetical protein
VFDGKTWSTNVNKLIFNHQGLVWMISISTYQKRLYIDIKGQRKRRVGMIERVVLLKKY